MSSASPSSRSSARIAGFLVLLACILNVLAAPRLVRDPDSGEDALLAAHRRMADFSDILAYSASASLASAQIPPNAPVEALRPLGLELERLVSELEARRGHFSQGGSTFLKLDAARQKVVESLLVVRRAIMQQPGDPRLAASAPAGVTKAVASGLATVLKTTEAMRAEEAANIQYEGAWRGAVETATTAGNLLLSALAILFLTGWTPFKARGAAPGAATPPVSAPPPADVESPAALPAAAAIGAALPRAMEPSAILAAFTSGILMDDPANLDPARERTPVAPEPRDRGEAPDATQSRVETSGVGQVVAMPSKGVARVASLPRSRPGDSTLPEVSPAAVSTGGSRLGIIIEDDPDHRDLVTSELQSYGVCVQRARTLEIALDLLGQLGRESPILCESPFLYVGAASFEAAEKDVVARVLELAPRMRILVAASGNEPESDPRATFLRKPFNRDEWLAALFGRPNCSMLDLLAGIGFVVDREGRVVDAGAGDWGQFIADAPWKTGDFRDCVGRSVFAAFTGGEAKSVFGDFHRAVATRAGATCSRSFRRDTPDRRRTIRLTARQFPGPSGEPLTLYHSWLESEVERRPIGLFDPDHDATVVRGAAPARVDMCEFCHDVSPRDHGPGGGQWFDVETFVETHGDAGVEPRSAVCPSCVRKLAPPKSPVETRAA